MNAYEVYSTYLFSKAGALGIPLSGTFELTARCNLDCKMCYIHKRENDSTVRCRERSAEQWLALASECQKAGLLHLLLTGGEPMLRPDFKEIYAGCRQLGLLVSINSNATLINDDMVAFLAANPPARINITLYGASAETYGALCGDASAYQRVVRAILALKEAGVSVKLNFSTTAYNHHETAEVFQFAEAHGIPIQAASYMFPATRACENGCCESERMTPAESAREQLVQEQLHFTREEMRERLEKKLAGIRVADPNSECQELPTERLRCRAGSSTFWVTWDGQLRPCGIMTKPSVEISADFLQAWKAIRAAREEIYIPAQCTSCEIAHACDQCAAICQAETGSFTEVPHYMCERTKEYLSLARKMIEVL